MRRIKEESWQWAENMQFHRSQQEKDSLDALTALVFREKVSRAVFANLRRGS